MKKPVRAWLVAYDSLRKAPDTGSTGVHNVVLIGKHPVEWACQQVEPYTKFFVTVLHFFHEIPLDLALKMTDDSYQHWVSVEDHR